MGAAARGNTPPPPSVAAHALVFVRPWARLQVKLEVTGNTSDVVLAKDLRDVAVAQVGVAAVGPDFMRVTRVFVAGLGGGASWQHRTNLHRNLIRGVRWVLAP
jgi:hypothetical protein